MSDESRSLYSPLSISRDLLPWAVWVICLLTIIWTGLTAWGEVSSRRHADVLDTSLTVGSNAADSVPLIIVYSILSVMVGNFISGGGIMIMARATRDYLYDKIARQRGKASGRGPGRGPGSLGVRDRGLEPATPEGGEARENRSTSRPQAHSAVPRPCQDRISRSQPGLV